MSRAVGGRRHVRVALDLGRIVYPDSGCARAAAERVEQLGSPAIAIRETLERHPRLHMKREVVDWSRREARLRPDSRLGLLVRLGFATLVRSAPFES